MDPLTAFVIAILMMLLNAGVLGLARGDFAHELRPSVLSWQLGTLAIALGCLVLVAQLVAPAWLTIPLGNGLVLLGLTGYWRALRQFNAQPLGRWMLLPTPLLMAGLWWFAVVSPGLSIRIIITTIMWMVVLGGCVLALLHPRAGTAAVSRRILAGIFIIVILFVLSRMVYFALNPNAVRTVLDTAHWVNAITPLVASVLPVIGTTAFLQLCSERIARQWELAASTDHLTGLANRRTLATHGERRLQRARRDGEGIAVAVIDIDHFKRVNDQFGHAVGDVVLRHVARTIASACREGDLAARQGGEEFVAMLHGVDAASAAAMGERIRAAVQDTPVLLSTGPMPMTVSVGIAVAEAADQGLDDLLRRADVALYEAKAGGRNRVVCALPRQQAGGWTAPGGDGVDASAPR